MEELRPGLWTWTAPHPAWTPDDAGPEGWDQDVRSCALVAGGDLVLLDPLEPPAAVLELAGGRTVSVVLTCAWHQRSAAALADRFGAAVYAPQEGLDGLELAGKGYAIGDELPGSVVAAGAYYPAEAILWLPEQRALFAGDAFTAPPLRFQRSWLPPGVALDDALARLRPLLELPVEVFVVGHGEPVTEGVRDALREALEP
jgi:glyoxylase-like metal-dependent hydrolase (beta-lactamase superfamily II)